MSWELSTRLLICISRGWFQEIEPTIRLHHLPSVNFETWKCKQVTPFWWVPRSLRCGPWLFFFNSWYWKFGDFFTKIYSNLHKKNTVFQSFSNFLVKKSDQICREKVTNVNKERWVGKEIQTADYKIMHCLVNLPNHFWTMAKVTSPCGVKSMYLWVHEHEHTRQ
jgi:hypothetical protein